MGWRIERLNRLATRVTVAGALTLALVMLGVTSQGAPQDSDKPGKGKDGAGLPDRGGIPFGSLMAWQIRGRRPLAAIRDVSSACWVSRRGPSGIPTFPSAALGTCGTLD